MRACLRACVRACVRVCRVVMFHVQRFETHTHLVNAIVSQCVRNAIVIIIIVVVVVVVVVVVIHRLLCVLDRMIHKYTRAALSISCIAF